MHFIRIPAWRYKNIAAAFVAGVHFSGTLLHGKYYRGLSLSLSWQARDNDSARSDVVRFFLGIRQLGSYLPSRENSPHFNARRVINDLLSASSAADQDPPDEIADETDLKGRRHSS